MLSNEKFDMECPSCHRTLSYTGDQLQKGYSGKCPSCGNEIRFEEKRSGAVSKLEEETKQSLEDIEKKVTVTIDD